METSNFVEGSARISFNKSANAFYNPVQEFNRDVTVLVLQQFVADRMSLLNSQDIRKDLDVTHNNSDSFSNPPKKKRIKIYKEKRGIRILDALSASGLRAIRFAKEVPFVDTIVANDFSKDAVDTIQNNIVANGVENVVSVRYGDAVQTMMENRTIESRFDAIDLDPYGSPVTFLDSAIQSVDDGGLLMVTCTDMAVLCGNTPEACFAKYNSVSLKHKACHEMALRILLRAVDSHANRHSRYIQPLLCVSVDFYIRVFVRVWSSAQGAKDSVVKLSYVLKCTGCETTVFQPLVRKTEKGNSVKFTPSIGCASTQKCQFCGHSIHLGGPIYTAPIHDYAFVKRLLTTLSDESQGGKLRTKKRIEGILSVISEELSDVPLYIELPQLMHVVKTEMPKFIQFRSALLNAGYRVSISHASPKSLKTDAPFSFIWDVVRKLASQSNVSPKLAAGSPGNQILASSITHDIDFKIHAEARAKSEAEGLLRFQDNKGKNWGPKQKAKGSVHIK